MNANSNGSVMPQTNAHTAADPKIPIAAFLFPSRAVCTMARAAPGTPNIMQGKKPDIYIPSDHVTSSEVCPAQKWVRSPSPIVSNQNTLFSA